MKIKFVLMGLAITMALASFAAMPADGPDELWEMTMKMEMAGMSMPGHTMKFCQKKGDREPKTAQPDKDTDCKTTDVQHSGNKTSWKMSCTKPEKMTASGEMTYGMDSYEGTMKMVSKDGEITQHMVGKKVGSCTWEDPMKKVQAMQAQNKAMIAKECDKQVEDLQPMLIFGGKDMPEASLMCKDRKADFCARFSKLTAQMKDPKGYEDVNYKFREWRTAAKLCGIDPATVSGPVCKVALDKKDWSFITKSCPTEGRAVALKYCVGLDYTAVLDSPYKDVCQAYGEDLAKKDVADEKVRADGKAKTGKTKTDDKTNADAADPSSQQAPAAAGKPSVTDSVMEGAKSLKKLLKF
jgi:hypothetical protein